MTGSTVNLSLKELVETVATRVKLANIYTYKPNRGAQTEFHKSASVGRLLIGSNRSGKTYGGISEDVWWATGLHPHQRTPEPPTYGRIITVDRDHGIDEIILPKLKQFIPQSFLINGSFDDSYSKRKAKLTLVNGSTIEIMTHGQDLDSFAGTPRHWLHADEEPPKAIFTESKARLLDYSGHFWITMTPVEGITWVYEDLVEKDSKNVAVFKIDVRDNPHISEKAIQTLSEDLDEIEEDIRVKGKIVPRGGLILKHFNYDTHVISQGLPARSWNWYLSIDAGLRNATAIYWHAVAPDGVVITFYEHYRTEWTVLQHVMRVREITQELGKMPEMAIGDPAMGQRSQITGTSVLDEYRKHGIEVVPGKKNVNVGLDKMNEYLRQNRWYITENCVMGIKAARKYAWKTHVSPKTRDRVNPPEQPVKKDDHSPDSWRYFYSFMPSLDPNAQPMALRDPLRDNRTRSLTETQPHDFPWRVDTGLFRPPSQVNDLGFGEVP